jgi:hypothetical protein
MAYHRDNITINRLIKGNLMIEVRDLERGYFRLFKGICILGNGGMICFMEMVFLYLKIIKDTKGKWLKGFGREKEHSIIWMEGYIKDNGRRVKNMDLVYKKVRIHIKVSGVEI